MIARFSRPFPVITALILALLTLSARSAPTTADDEDWIAELDAETEWMERAAAVNEGELEFIAPKAADGAHAHLNRIRITDESLTGGWVVLEQCHENIDAVPAAQILFRAGGIRDLEIVSVRNIGRAWVEGHSVQLEDVADRARLCIRAESQALQQLDNGGFRLRNGPYMRRFLDGYYPMRVALSIDYPTDRLRLVGQSPASQPGFSVHVGERRIEVDATFEGRLVTCLDFCTPGRDDCTAMAPACTSAAPAPMR